MFENKARKRKRITLLLVVALILISAFGLGYYLNYGSGINVNKENGTNNKNVGFKIPNSIRNPGARDIIANADSNEEKVDAAASAPDNKITASTKVVFKTYFTLCSHMVDEDPKDIKDFINLTKEDLQVKYPDWSLNEFSTQQVILKREIQTYCPRHYIISSNEGYIAIYVYNSEGVKTLYEMTDDPISVLTVEDQEKLKFGIVADSDEELQQRLEGLSD
jgi:hypothetical protein